MRINGQEKQRTIKVKEMQKILCDFNPDDYIIISGCAKCVMSAINVVRYKKRFVLIETRY